MFTREAVIAILVIGLVVVLTAGIILGKRIQRGRRRRELRARPLPVEWIQTLEHNVPLYAKLPVELRNELHGHIQVFLAEKHFEGCQGLELTDEMRVTVAAQACILLLNRPTNYYRKLSSVLLYPSTYVATTYEKLGAGMHLEYDSERVGESWSWGTVVLAWDDVQHSTSLTRDGDNVVLHEFAHQLDQADGAADGAPILSHRASYATWCRILSREYERLRKRVRSGRRTLLDEYGATDPAEFFAVATETFFERPRKLREKHPELYAELQRFYNVDPASWS